MAYRNDSAKDRMRANAVSYILKKGGQADKCEIAKLFGSGTNAVDSIMKGSWGQRIFYTSGSGTRTVYTIKDQEAAKKYLETLGMWGLDG
jgi:hypothetical protein